MISSARSSASVTGVSSALFRAVIPSEYKLKASFPACRAARSITSITGSTIPPQKKFDHRFRKLAHDALSATRQIHRRRLAEMPPALSPVFACLEGVKT